MKKYSILLAALFIIPIFSFSQIEYSKDFKYSVSKPYRVVDARSKYYFHHEGEIISVKISGARVVIQKFDAKSLGFIKLKVYEDMPRGYQLELVTKYNDKICIFYSLWDKPNTKEQLFYREIDIAACSFKGKGKLLIKVDGKITGRSAGGGGFFGSFGTVDKFSFNFSEDETKMLVQYRKRPKTRDDSKNYDVIGMNVFDRDVNEIWSNEVTMPYTEKKMNNLDYSIDAEGNSYVLATVFNDNTTDLRKTRGGKPNFHVELLRIKANTADIDITKIDMDGHFINRIWLYESPNDYMVCAGFYNDGRDLDDANGVFVFKVGKEGEIYDKSKHEIPLEVLNQYVSARTQAKNKKKNETLEFQELKLRELVLKDDGSFLLIGEQHYIRTHTTYSNGRSRTYYTYHYNDLLVTKIATDGSLAWMRKLPKRQTGKNGQGGMSYEYVNNNNFHYLLFLDNVKNMSLPIDKVPASHSDGAGGFLTAYKIADDGGEVSKLSIFDTKDVRGIAVYQFNTGRILSLSDNEFVIEVYKKKKEDVFIKVTLSE